MLNQATVEALYSTNYVDDYLDCVENLPNDLQRHLSRLRELDATCQTYRREIDTNQESLCKSDISNLSRTRALFRIQQALIAMQEIGDEKLQLVQTIQDLIENKGRQLEVDLNNLDLGKEQESNEPARDNNTSANNNSSNNTNNSDRPQKRARRTRTEALVESAQAMEMIMSENRSANIPSSSNGSQKRTNQLQANKKKKRKSRQGNQNQHREDTPPPPEDDIAIDPDEPTYCLCDQISYGEMILCDNDLCPIEWFHFSCVSLSNKPKGKWFCPKCRGDRPNIMKPKAQFLKELAIYNKEKEVKS
ncbi:inhibitor of growth protein 1 [Copidosoma floridanum]|uniref:inhibitor of growth protein 1 n=1 Tax=Copidosoma floridanum TaxID=29053 RepID=UPI0006C9CACA|nr:inhibitor of growth protein 1 [Copidosoma floridanum]